VHVFYFIFFPVLFSILHGTCCALRLVVSRWLSGNSEGGVHTF
jgi:hypothetical protein